MDETKDGKRVPHGLDRIMGPVEDSLYHIPYRAPGPSGRLPLTAQMLKEWPSGDLFALSQDVGMGLSPDDVLHPPILIMSTQGGMRNDAGEAVALGYHTGHWEIGRLVREAATAFRALGGIPYAAMVSDPCDGRVQGTDGMFDSLPYRNDAALVMRRLVRLLPNRQGVMGVATCDKGLPAMMMMLASLRDIPGILVPGGTTLLADSGEDAGKVQTIGARFAQREITLEYAAEMGCRACASPGGGCQFLGTAATSQVVGEAMGMTLPHSALIPSGVPLWEEMARQSARALWELTRAGTRMSDIVTDAAVRNAMVLHASFGGSTNLLIHLPAIAHSAGLTVPTADDWREVNRMVPRLVSVLPNGPVDYPTAVAFLAGGVPEVMLHLRRLGLLDLTVRTVSGLTLDAVLDWWEESSRRQEVRAHLRDREGIDPDQVILSPERAHEKGMTSTLTFPAGNLAPEGSVIKSTAIDRRVLDADGVYRLTGPARVFAREPDAIKAIKEGVVKTGDVMVLIGAGPMGTGMEESYQVTSALKHLPFGRQVALITDARFSGVSTGACIGHVSPEALAGGPLGKLQDGDLIEIVIDTVLLQGSINFVGSKDQRLSPDEGALVLASRKSHEGLAPDPHLPDDTRLWAALQNASGGPWRGSVYDVDRILAALKPEEDASPHKAVRGEHTT